ncbi:MAG: hypothetical protein Q9162_007336 [Coniocarpon cinnabarinum]
MGISIEEVNISDFEIMKSFSHKEGGQLSAPAADASMLVDNEQAAAVRNNWSVQQQRDTYENDPTAKFIKAIDSDSGEMLGIARWHFYPCRYQVSDLEYAGSKPKDDDASYPAGLNIPLYKGMLDQIFKRRPEWIVNGPQWYLTTVKVRESFRRRGAGSAMIRWGIEKARTEKCPAYLEAAADAENFYAILGFDDVGELRIDMRPFGIPAEAVFTRMATNVARTEPRCDD